MAFSTIEDVQGPIDLVIFPRTWTEFQDLLEPDNVILVEGKVDALGAEPKILVDSITTEWTLLDPATNPEPRPLLRREDVLPPPPDEMDDDGPTQSQFSAPQQRPITNPESTYTRAAAPATNGSMTETTEETRGSEPPDGPPDWHMVDMFPIDIGDYDEPIISEDMQSRQSKKQTAGSSAEKETNREQPVYAAEKEEKTEAKPKKVREAPQVAAETASTPASETLPKLIVPPPRPEVKPKEERPAKMLSITLKANGDRIRDQLKIQRIFGMLITHPGNDHFAFYVFEGSRSYLVEFPNYTTHVHDDLLNALKEISGIESVQVESIIYQ